MHNKSQLLKDTEKVCTRNKLRIHILTPDLQLGFFPYRLLKFSQLIIFIDICVSSNVQSKNNIWIYFK